MTHNDYAKLSRFASAIVITALAHSTLSAGEPAPGKWEILAPLPSARTEVAAVELGGHIYVMGGYEKNGDLVEAYDPVNNSWQGWAPMPTARHGLGAATLGSSIDVISGGPKPGATFSSVNEVFTPVN